ncbi:hypothetical protein SAMN05421874_11059 [Nonomuraea maritima]|uniref:Uncharacterized protein n=1 Tax=Nonomuraea maritima TaxID=683260 RepID=A0A1G9DYP7_9ACTN|nr:hypothetical protein [Nonomuraea maritima]SDK68995.1 hypothetical protein SAMN05421874_11059 [Nonomuraea maritima]
MAQVARIDVETRAQTVSNTLSAEQAEQIADAFGWQGIWFAEQLDGDADTRRPDTTWDLVGDRPHAGVTAKGRAAVHLAEGHDRLTRPLIMADGFGYGPSDLDALWRHLNTPYRDGEPGFLDQLLSMGIDVVLLGFAQRHTYLQANAAVAISCVQRAVGERDGDDPLTVGGIGMGGLITRYALAVMEADGLDHRTDKYFSYDTPHLGAWIPLVLQQLAHLHEALQPPEGGEPGPAALLRSPAAQQLLWGWVESADFSGPVAANPLREEFLDDLRRVGWFPIRPYKLGLASGLGTGVGTDLAPGTPVYDLQSADLQLTARVQPDGGERQNLGTIRLGPPVWTSLTSHVAAFDGAPGGTLDTWGRVADAMGLPIPERLRSSCFVPTVSAIALTRDPYQWQPDLYKDLRDLPKDETLLDAFCCDIANRRHCAVSQPLIEWFVGQLAGW